MPNQPAGSTSFEAAVNSFFWEELSPAVQHVVHNQAVRIFDELVAKADWAPLNCDMAAARWLATFRAAGIPAELCSGNYDPAHQSEVEHPLSSDHVWLRVEGKIFDPTAGQFNGPGAIKPQFYFDDKETK